VFSHSQGQTEKSARLDGTSVIPSTGDVVGPSRHVRFVPIAEVNSFNHFIGAGKYRGRECQPKRLCRRKIYHEF